MMNTKTFILSFALLCLGSLAFSQLTLTRNGCSNQLVATIETPGISIPDPFYTAGRQVNCELNSLFAHRAGASIGSVTFRLQEKLTDSSPWTQVASAQFSSRSHTFSYNFVQGALYRVRIGRLPSWSGHIIVNDNCIFLGAAMDPSGSPIVGFTNEYEFVDNPTYSGVLLDVFGMPFNSVFCDGDPVFLDGSGSFGETSYRVNMSMHDINDRSIMKGWTDCGIYDGKLGTLNIDDLWKTNFPNWRLWPNNSYRIHIVLHNECNVWSNFFTWFDVVNSGCRTASLSVDPADISIGPNPATSRLNVKGLEQYEEDNTPFIITDLTGKIVKQGDLSTTEASIGLEGLIPGIYFARLMVGDKEVVKKFSVVR